MANASTTTGKLEGNRDVDVVTVGEAMALLVAQHPGPLSGIASGVILLATICALSCGPKELTIRM